MSRDQSATCGTCRWWTGQKSDHGECHRNPPQAAGIVQQMNALSRTAQPAVLSAFPTVVKTGWCGEWSARAPELLS